MNPLSQVTTGSAKRAGSFLAEFKNFAFKGNLIDLALAVVIGGAFGRVLDSLVKNIVMPLVSLVMPSEQAYAGWKLTIGAKEVPYGLFISDIVSFLLMALVVFIVMVKLVGWLMKSSQQEAAAPPALSKDQELLTEIRDLLKQGRA